MELVPFKPEAGALVESGGGAHGDSIPAMVAAQQELLHAQVDQLQLLVVAQCRLTGVNPLAQEMVRSSCLWSVFFFFLISASSTRLLDVLAYAFLSL